MEKRLTMARLFEECIGLETVKHVQPFELFYRVTLAAGIIR